VCACACVCAHMYMCAKNCVCIQQYAVFLSAKSARLQLQEHLESLQRHCTEVTTSKFHVSLSSLNIYNRDVSSIYPVLCSANIWISGQ